MIPPVSLPLNGGPGSSRAGVNASIPHTAARLMAPIIRIADSISFGGTIRRIAADEKNGRGLGPELSAGCCRVALDLVRASRHRPLSRSSGGLPMYDLSSSIKKTGLGAALGVLLGLFAFGPAAQAANPFEMNFWLSGPKYDGRVAPCEAALPTIA